MVRAIKRALFAIKNSFAKNNIFETVFVFSFFLGATTFFLICADNAHKSIAFLIMLYCLNKLFKLSDLSMEFFEMIERAHAAGRPLSELEKIHLNYRAYPLNEFFIDLFESLFKKNRWVLHKVLSLSCRIAHFAISRCQSAAIAIGLGNQVVTNKVILAKLRKARTIAVPAKRKLSLLASKKNKTYRISRRSQKMFKTVDTIKVRKTVSLKQIKFEMINRENHRLMKIRTSLVGKEHTALDDLNNVPALFHMKSNPFADERYDFNLLPKTSKILLKAFYRNNLHGVNNLLFWDKTVKFSKINEHRLRSFQKQRKFYSYMGVAFHASAEYYGPFGPAYYRTAVFPSLEAVADVVNMASAVYPNCVIIDDFQKDYGAKELLRLVVRVNGRIYPTFRLLKENVLNIDEAAAKAGVEHVYHRRLLPSDVMSIDNQLASLCDRAKNKNNVVSPQIQALAKEAVTFSLGDDRRLCRCTQYRRDLTRMLESIQGSHLRRQRRLHPERFPKTVRRSRNPQFEALVREMFLKGQEELKKEAQRQGK